MAAMTNLASAAQIIINNLSGLHPITNSGGVLVPIGTGFTALGSIALSDAAVMASPNDRDGLEAVFTQFGTSVAYGAGGSGGFFSGVITSPINPGDPLIGQNIYIVSGDGSDIASSSSIWIFKSDKLFEDDVPDPFSTTINLDGALSEGSIMVGTPVVTFVPLAGSSFNGSQMEAFVPEPGAGLLCGLAVLMLCGTRKRRQRQRQYRD